MLLRDISPPKPPAAAGPVQQLRSLFATNKALKQTCVTEEKTAQTFPRAAVTSAAEGAVGIHRADLEIACGLHDSGLLQNDGSLRKNPTVDAGASDESCSSLDEHDALHVGARHDLLLEINRDFKTQTDEHATPLGLIKFYEDHQIKTHAPPLVIIIPQPRRPLATRCCWPGRRLQG
jgi:hypothetical protein